MKLVDGRYFEYCTQVQPQNLFSCGDRALTSFLNLWQKGVFDKGKCMKCMYELRHGSSRNIAIFVENDLEGESNFNQQNSLVIMNISKTHRVKPLTTEKCSDITNSDLWCGSKVITARANKVCNLISSINQWIISAAISIHSLSKFAHPQQYSACGMRKWDLLMKQNVFIITVEFRSSEQHEYVYASCMYAIAAFAEH